MSSLEELTAEINLNPDDDELYLYRGQARYKIKDFIGAIEDFCKAIKLNPLYAADAFFERARTSEKFTTLLFNHAFENGANDKCSPSELQIKYYLTIKEDYLNAINAYDKFLEVNRGCDYQYANRGYAKIQLKRYVEAIEDYTKAIEFNPNDIFSSCFYYYRGDAKLSLNDYHGAIQDFTEALKLNPKDGRAFYFRGIAKINLNQKDHAREDIDRAAELGYFVAFYLLRNFYKSTRFFDLQALGGKQFENNFTMDRVYFTDN